MSAYDQDGLFSGAYRLLLVFAPDAEHEDLRRMEQENRAREQELDDRDMRVVRVIGEQDHPLRRRYRAPVGEFRLLLIGKDGGVKRSEADAVALEEVFAQVDSMPMRRREMRERGR